MHKYDFRLSTEPNKWHRRKCCKGREKKEKSFLNKEIREGFIEGVTFAMEEMRCTRVDWKAVNSPRALNKIK